LNTTFDGDTGAIYVVHDKKALDQLYKNAFLGNCFTYDSDGKMLSVIRHESLYAAYILTEYIIPNFNKYNNDSYNINSLDEAEENIEWFNNNLDMPVKFNNQYYTYGIILFNKWAGFDQIIINYHINKKHANDISTKLFAYHGKNNYYKYLTDFNKYLLTFISVTKHSPSLETNDFVNILNDDTETLFKKLPDHNPTLGIYMYESLVDRSIKNYDQTCTLLKLYKSGSRFNKKQLARMCLCIGYIADGQNVIIPDPVKTCLIKGQTELDSFKASPGTMKGIDDKSKHTPKSGYLERTLCMALSPLEIIEEDCGNNNTLEIELTSEKLGETLVGKLFKINEFDVEYHVFKDSDIQKYLNKKIYIRSTIHCLTKNNRLCRKCFGYREFPTNDVGITAGQVISERLTQLTMRSFHTSGAAELDLDEDIKTFFENNLIDLDVNLSERQYILKFNNINDCPEKINVVPGFEKIEDNLIYFNYDNNPVLNKDVVSIISDIGKLLKAEIKDVQTPDYYYKKMLNYLLLVGVPYSSFVEMVFTNNILTSINPKKFWRYNQDDNPVKKVGKFQLAYIIDSELEVLYQANKKTISHIDIDADNLDDDKLLTFYQKIWHMKFDD
jgi:hypothetical protein